MNSETDHPIPIRLTSSNHGKSLTGKLLEYVHPRIAIYFKG